MADAVSSEIFFRVPLVTPELVRIQQIYLSRNGRRQRIQLIKPD